MKDNLEWFFNNLYNYGNSLISVKHYEEVDKIRIGNHIKRLLKASSSGENDCYVVELVKEEKNGTRN